MTAVDGCVKLLSRLREERESKLSNLTTGSVSFGPNGPSTAIGDGTEDYHYVPGGEDSPLALILKRIELRAKNSGRHSAQVSESILARLDEIDDRLEDIDTALAALAPSEIVKEVNLV